MSSNPGVVVQNLREFTLQIRDAKGNIQGTGILISESGEIVTCAHVVEAVLDKPVSEITNGEEVPVYFPQVREGDNKTQPAALKACFIHYQDDVAVLKLKKPLPSAKLTPAKLGRAEGSIEHPFRTYGYPKLGIYDSARANGIILGSVEPPEGRIVQIDPIMLQSQGIARGMSGAAVLDIEKNLVVGIISEVYSPPRGDPKHRDAAWAVDAHALNLEPLGVPLEDIPVPKKAVPQSSIPEEAMDEVKRTARPQPTEGMRRAPALIEEWVGREELLGQLSADFADPGVRITGLVGFGGEGKSSLARRWIDSVVAEHVFWWAFYDNREVEQFFEAALTYLAGPELTAQVTSTGVRAGIIAQLLREKRVVFVLDGFEVMQHQEGDRYGQIASNDLREFLGYFAGLEHDSFCLITTRTPLLDLMQYTSYQHRNVDRLSAADGLALLRKQGVKGSDEELIQFVNTWDGHALTVSLLGAYVCEALGGDLSQLDEDPLADESRYERVYRVLRRYDEYLGEAEQAFLTLFSAFRTPVREAAFPTVFRTQTDATALNAPIAALSNDEFEEMIIRLRGYRILRYDPVQQHYITHPLIREHYAARFKAVEQVQQEHSHMTIKLHYLVQAGRMLSFPTLDDLAPLIEAVHHACRAGAYDEAIGQLFWGRIDQGRAVILHQLGAYETTLALMREFFPCGDISQEPQVSDPFGKSYILNAVGVCLTSLGRMSEAILSYGLSAKMAIDMKDWRNASVTYQNLAALRAHLGALPSSAQAARDALALAQRMEPGRDGQQMEMNSMGIMGWAEHLCGKLAVASDAFQEAEALVRTIDPDDNYLYAGDGIQHADHLRRVGDAAYARWMTEANLKSCEEYRWSEQISQCHRVLGDLDTDAGQYKSAREHYDEALRIARGITERAVLTGALLSLGRLLARHPQPGESARPYLDEALGYCLESGYRIYEADCRVALAWLHHSEGRADAARAEAERAKAMSVEMGYHWGVVDAEEVLGEL